MDYLGEINPRALAVLPRSGFELVRAKRVKKDDAERKANLKGVDVVYFRGDDFYSDYVLRDNPDLKLAVYGGTGYQQYIDVAAATKYGIAVASTPGQNAYSVP